MSTKLELCRRLRREAGISGNDSLPASVTSQTGEMLKIVNWIDSAYQDIQNLHDNWKFLKTDISFATILNTTNYTPASIDESEVATWKTDTFRCYLTATGTSDEQEMYYLPWDDFRASYMFGANRSATGRPSHFSIKDDNSIEIWPKPSAAYTITGEAYLRAQVMDENTDEPLFPSQFHDILVWRAIVFYAGHEAAPEVYAVGVTEHKRLLKALERHQLPKMRLGAALA